MAGCEKIVKMLPFVCRLGAYKLEGFFGQIRRDAPSARTRAASYEVERAVLSFVAYLTLQLKGVPQRWNDFLRGRPVFAMRETACRSLGAGSRRKIKYLSHTAGCTGQSSLSRFLILLAWAAPPSPLPPTGRMFPVEGKMTPSGGPPHLPENHPSQARTPHPSLCFHSAASRQ
jgi:hypothetical protein